MSAAATTVVRELDMGFPVAEVVSGIERAVRTLGGDPATATGDETTVIRAPRGVVAEVSRMPAERTPVPSLFPRTLLVLRGDAEPVRALYDALLLVFLRVTG